MNSQKVVTPAPRQERDKPAKNTGWQVPTGVQMSRNYLKRLDSDWSLSAFYQPMAGWLVGMTKSATFRLFASS